MKLKFKRIYVEITNNCNLCCSFCPRNTRKKTFMSVESFKYILNQISPLCKNIYLHLMGEPLLHPELKEILEISKQNNFSVNITTNGTLLKQKLDILLNGNVKKLTISLHSFEANTTGQSLDEYLQNAVDVAKELQNKTNTIVEFRLWNEGENLQSKKNTLNNYIITFLQKCFNNNFDIAINQKNYTLGKNVYLGFDNTFVWPEIAKQTNNVDTKKFCFALRTHFGILCDGTVVPCCLDNNGKLALGNIFKNDINEIINGKKAMAIYNGFSNRKAVENLCKTCIYATRFDK